MADNQIFSDDTIEAVQRLIFNQKRNALFSSVAKLAAKTLPNPFPDKKYSIIYADPPRFYNQRANTDRFRGGARRHHPLMTYKQLTEMPVQQIIGKNCALFMWATAPKLDRAILLMQSWGFEYKTVAFTWMKRQPKLSTVVACKRRLELIGRPEAERLRDPCLFFGVGHYTKSNAEFCLLGIKGKMKPVSNSVSSAILEPKREHSRKPDCARARIEALFGDVPRIELFARQKVKGWDAWGNEV